MFIVGDGKPGPQSATVPPQPAQTGVKARDQGPMNCAASERVPVLLPIEGDRITLTLNGEESQAPLTAGMPSTNTQTR